MVDATCGTRAARAPFLDVARVRGASTRAVHVDAPVGDALLNAALRLLDRYDALPDVVSAKVLGKRDPHVFLPGVVFRHHQELEPPGRDEGFDEVETAPFVRRSQGAPAWFVPVAARGVVPRLPAGALVLGYGWDGHGPRVDEVPGVAEIAWCPHLEAGPPRCWCRPPLPGLVAVLARRHGVDLARSRLVVAGPADRTLAARCGLTLVEPP